MLFHSSTVGNKVHDTFPMPTDHSLHEEWVRIVIRRRTVALCLHCLGMVIVKTVLPFLILSFKFISSLKYFLSLDDILSGRKKRVQL